MADKKGNKRPLDTEDHAQKKAKKEHVQEDSMVTLSTYTASKTYAFVTLLYGSQPFFVEALVLARSLKKLRDDADVILLVGEGVSKDILRLIRSTKLFSHMISVETPVIHDSHIGTKNRWTKHVFNKCYSWGLTQYAKVMFLDADIVVHKRGQLMRLFDEFVDTDIPAACIMGEKLLTHRELVRLDNSGAAIASKLIAGVMVLTPTETVFQEMMEALKTPSPFEGAFFTNHEEVFLGSFFREWWTIHCRYQFIPLSLNCDDTVKEYYKGLKKDEVVATHFCGWKPHAFLKSPSYVEADKRKYQKQVPREGYNIFVMAVDAWLQLADKIDRKVYKKTNRHLLDVGDWKTKVDYNMHGDKKECCVEPRRVVPVQYHHQRSSK